MKEVEAEYKKLLEEKNDEIRLRRQKYQERMKAKQEKE